MPRLVIRLASICARLIRVRAGVMVVADVLIRNMLVPCSEQQIAFARIMPLAIWFHGSRENDPCRIGEKRMNRRGGSMRLYSGNHHVGDPGDNRFDRAAHAHLERHACRIG